MFFFVQKDKMLYSIKIIVVWEKLNKKKLFTLDLWAPSPSFQNIQFFFSKTQIQIDINIKIINIHWLLDFVQNYKCALIREYCFDTKCM